MTTLSADAPRTYELGNINELGVVAGDIIYEGALVGDNGSGYARPLNAGDPFRGICEQNADNSAAGAAAGDVNVRVLTEGKVVMDVTGASGLGDVGKAVYASDDDTLTLTAGSNTLVGHVHRHVSGTECVVAFKAADGAEAQLTDSSGGSASDTIAAIGASYDQDEVRNAIASLAAKVNHLLARQGN